MTRSNENLYKVLIIFGVSGLLFWAFMPKSTAAATPTLPAPSKGFDSSNAPKADIANADIVANAYKSALSAGEPASQLTELNKELVKEFGMRCYKDQNTNKLIVCDSAGNVITTK
jgi:hypothetical protein